MINTSLRKKWQKMDILSQLANIGSEVSRLIYWRKSANKEECEAAFWRVLDLLDLSIDCVAGIKKAGEILRLREVLCDYFLQTKLYRIRSQTLQAYFLPFALTVRKKYDSNH
ncbi:MAG: hypothetical protein WC650_05705 [Candidatus Doudnabacteria bacterium]